MNVGERAQNIRYAKSGDLNIAFSVIGEGPDLVVAPGFISHLDIMWEEPSVVHFYSRLASFRRVVTFDKRGTGPLGSGDARADVGRVGRRPARGHGCGRVCTRRHRGHFGGWHD